MTELSKAQQVILERATKILDVKPALEGELYGTNWTDSEALAVIMVTEANYDRIQANFILDLMRGRINDSEGIIN